MTNIAIPAFGFAATAIGLIFLIGCFVRVDSPRFVERAEGDPVKLLKLQTLQDAWLKLGKARQFAVSSAPPLVFGVGLLTIWLRPELGKYYWVLLVALVVNLGAALVTRRYALDILDPNLSGHAEALKVSKQAIRLCLSLGLVFVVLVAKA